MKNLFQTFMLSIIIGELLLGSFIPSEAYADNKKNSKNQQQNGQQDQQQQNQQQGQPGQQQAAPPPPPVPQQTNGNGGNQTGSGQQSGQPSGQQSGQPSGQQSGQPSGQQSGQPSGQQSGATHHNGQSAPPPPNPNASANQQGVPQPQGGQQGTTSNPITAPSKAELAELLRHITNPEDRQVAQQYVNMQNHPELLKGEGNFFGNTAKLIAGQGMADFAGMLMNGYDGPRWKAFLQDMVISPDFWLQMAVFEGTMNVSRSALMGIIKNPDTSKSFAFFQHMMLPIGDFVTNALMGIINDPHFQAYLKTYDPHTAVCDSDKPIATCSKDNPDNKPTNSLAVRKKVRTKLRRALAFEILADQQKTNPYPGYFYHAFQMGAVGYVFGKLTQRVQTVQMMFFKKEMTKEGAMRIALLRPGYAKLAAAQAEGATGFEFYAINSIKLGRLAEWMAGESEGLLMKFAGRAVGATFDFFGGAVGMALFFAVNDLATDLVVPAWKVWGQVPGGIFEGVKPDLAKKQQELDDAINWYLDPKRTEQFPNSALSWREKAWLEFFTNYDNYDPNFKGDPKYKGGFESKFFKDNQNGWHSNYNSMTGQPWNQAFKVMSDISETYLNTSVEDISFYNCFELPKNIDLSSNMAILKTYIGTQNPFENFQTAKQAIEARKDTYRCREDWVRKNTPAFIENLKKYTALDYIRARINAVDKVYDNFRNTQLLAKLWEEWQIWSKDIEGKVEERSRKNKWFQWIARGMKTDDPAFVANGEFWHPAADDNDALWVETIDYVSAFDNEVLHRKNGGLGDSGWFAHYVTHSQAGARFVACSFTMLTDMKGPSYGRCLDAKAQNILSTHEANMAEFIKNGPKQLTRENLASLIKYNYPMTFEDSANPWETSRVSDSAKRAQNLQLKNFFEDTSEAEQKHAQLLADETLKRFAVRWFWNYMADTPEFLANEGGWHPDPQKEEEFGKFTSDVLGTYLIAPFVNMAPTNNDEIGKVAGDIVGIFQNSNQPQSEEGRARLLLVAATFDEIEKEQENETAELKTANATYIGKINRLAYAGGGHGAGQITLFSQGGMYDMGWWGNGGWGIHTETDAQGKTSHHLGALYRSHYGTIASSGLPKGDINVFNFEIQAYLERLMNAFARFQIVPDRNLSNAEYKNYVETQPESLATLLSLTKAIGEVNIEQMQESQRSDGGLKFFSPQDMILNMSIQIGYNNTGLISAFTKDRKAPQGKMSTKDVTDELNRSIREDGQKLGLQTGALWDSSNATNTFSKTINARINIAQQMAPRLGAILNELKNQGSNVVTYREETKLRGLLGPAYFSVPTLAASAGYATVYTNIVSVLASKMVEVENKKTVHSRIGCFMLQDTLCSPDKNAQ